MNRTTRNLVALGLLLATPAASGCSQLHSLIGHDTTAASKPPPEAGFDAERAAAVAKLEAVMSKMTYKDSFEDLLSDWQRHVGAELSQEFKVALYRGEIRPFAIEKNPEPEWIESWNSKDVYPNLTSWAQARTNKTWLVDANKAYESYKKVVDAYEASYRARLEATKKNPNFYERAPALCKLLKEALKPTDFTFPYYRRPHGPAVEIQETLIHEYEEMGMLDEYSCAYFTDEMKPRSAPEEERQEFLSLAAAGRAEKFMRPLPEWKGSAKSPAKQVHYRDSAFADDADRREVPRFVAGARKFPTYGTAALTAPETLEQVTSGGDAHDPKTVSLYARVTEIRREGVGAVVTLVTYGNDEDQVCHEYGPLLRGSRHLYREEKCVVTATRHTQRNFHVTFPAFPPNLERGVAMWLLADVEAVKSKGAPVKMTVDVTMRGRFVRCAGDKAADVTLGVSSPTRANCEADW
jgi:hypothetical protein